MTKKQCRRQRGPAKFSTAAAWWFLDQKQGITAQLDALSNAGLLSRFVGMVTDSRSFMSYPRHEYFRRILCDIIGQDVTRGELPNDDALLGRLVQDVCYGNARNYLRLPPGEPFRESRTRHLSEAKDPAPCISWLKGSLPPGINHLYSIRCSKSVQPHSQLLTHGQLDSPFSQLTN